MTELLTHALIFLTALIGFLRYLIGVWYKFKTKDQMLGHKLSMEVLNKVQETVKDLEKKFTEQNVRMDNFTRQLMAITNFQKKYQQTFNQMVTRMDNFVRTSDKRFEKLEENVGKVIVKE